MISNKIPTSTPLILDTDRQPSRRTVSFAEDAIATTTTTTPSNGVASATITSTSTIMKPKPKKKSKKEELSSMSHSSSVSSVDTMSVLTLLREASGVENRIRKNHRILERTSTFGSFSQMEFVWTFLTVLGIIGGIIGFYIDIVVEYIVIGRDNILAGMVESTPGLQMFVWVLFNLAFVVLALLLTLWVAPIAEGSGIPPVKAILTGVDSLKEPLSLKTLIVKVLGVPCVVGAGMFVGKVGGMIHIGAALADNLMKLKPFRPLRNNKTLRVQLIGCGCALGVGAVFGAPAGGVLFALEAVGTYYSLRNYLKNFYVALMAAFVSRLLHSLHDQSILLVPVYHVNLDVPSFTIIDFVTLGFLGVVMGLLGVLFAFLNEKLLWLRNKVGRRFFLFFRRKHFKIDDPNSKFRFLKYPLTFVQTQFLWTVLICVITSILCFPTVIGNFMSLSPNALIEDLMLNKPLLKEYGAKGDWIPAQLSEYISETFHSNGMPPEYYTAIFSSLGLFILVRVIITPLSVSLPIPSCIYVTLLIMGAGFGRFWGELWAYILPDGWSMLFGNERAYSLIRPGAYAIVGGLALSASATQAFSTVLIFLEIAGMGIYWPAMLASMIAVKISRLLYYSAYDAQIKLRGWPALLETKTDSEDIKVRDIMIYVDELSVVEETVTFNELQSIFESTKIIPKTFPVVNSKKDLVLVGVVSVKQLQTLYQTLKDSVGKVQSEYEKEQAELRAKVPVSTTNLNARKGIERVNVVTEPRPEQGNLLLDFDDFFIGNDWIAEGDKIEKEEDESDDDDDFISNLINNPFSVLPGAINLNNILGGGSSSSDNNQTATATSNVSPAVTTTPPIVASNEIELEESIKLEEPKEETIVDKKKNELIRLDYDTCQIAIADDTPAVLAHLLFSQLRLDDVFVLWMGRLIGQLHREVLIRKISDRKVLLEQKIV